jgi:hypothetical protein
MDTTLGKLTGQVALMAFLSAGCSPQPNSTQNPVSPEPAMQTTTDRQANPSTLPSAAAVITHEVGDYATWRTAFDGHADARKRAGILGTHVNRSADNPNLVSVYLAAGDFGALRAFLGNEDLKATMMRSGVKGPPTVVLITPVEDMTVKDRPLPGVIVSHHVTSFDAWKKAFDADAGSRAKAGIVGHAVNRSLEDPNLVVVYLQSTTLDQVRGFVGSPDLKDAMAKAGVEGAPRIAFVQGADWGP